jgi:hypothetical protein
MNVKKCSRGPLEVIGIIQNDVKIGQVYIILDDLYPISGRKGLYPKRTSHPETKTQ